MDHVALLRPNLILSPSRLRLAGWLAVAGSVLTVPWFLFLSYQSRLHDPSLDAAKACMVVGRVALYIYLLLLLQGLLNRRYAFHGTDKTISLLIQASIIQGSASILGLVVPELSPAVGLFGVVMVVIIGILHVMLGLWLLHLPATLGGMHRPFCYLNIVTGVAFGSIVLLPVGMVAGMITDIMLGSIFLHAARVPCLPLTTTA